MCHESGKRNTPVKVSSRDGAGKWRTSTYNRTRCHEAPLDLWEGDLSHLPQQAVSFLTITTISSLYMSNLQWFIFQLDLDISTAAR